VRATFARRWPTWLGESEAHLLARGFVGVRREANTGPSQQTPSDRRKRLEPSHLLHGVSWRHELIAGRQNAESDPPEVANKLISEAAADRPMGEKSRLAPIP
jgi:hypothetical protein